MFKPSERVQYCPICGEPLEIESIDQFGVPVGYSAQCAHCNKYFDIWVNGLREVQCGTWNSPDYDSNFGTMTKKDKWREKQILLVLNGHLFWERLKEKAVKIKQHIDDSKGVTA